MVWYHNWYLRYYASCHKIGYFSRPKKMWNLNLAFEMKNYCLAYNGMDYKTLCEEGCLINFQNFVFQNFWHCINGFSGLAQLTIRKSLNIDRVTNQKKIDKYFAKWLPDLYKLVETQEAQRKKKGFEFIRQLFLYVCIDLELIQYCGSILENADWNFFINRKYHDKKDVKLMFNKMATVRDGGRSFLQWLGQLKLTSFK